MVEKFEEILRNTKNSTEHFKKTMKVKRILKIADDEFTALLYELGCEIYEEHLNKTNDQASVNELIELISVKRSYIKSLKKELNILHGQIECDNCGKLTSFNFDFCPFCGVKLFKNIPENQNNNETDENMPEEL